MAAPRGKGSLRIWPLGDPQPGVSLIEYTSSTSTTVPALVELCHTEPCAADFQARALGAGTHLRLDVVGYFAPLALTAGPAGPAGPAGAQGPQGPADATGLRGIDSYPAQAIPRCTPWMC